MQISGLDSVNSANKVGYIRTKEASIISLVTTVSNTCSWKSQNKHVVACQVSLDKFDRAFMFAIHCDLFQENTTNIKYLAYCKATRDGSGLGGQSWYCRDSYQSDLSDWHSQRKEWSL